MRQHSAEHITRMALASSKASCDTEAARVACGKLELFTEHERGEGWRIFFRYSPEIAFTATSFHVRLELAAARVRRALPERA